MRYIVFLMLACAQLAADSADIRRQELRRQQAMDAERRAQIRRDEERAAQNRRDIQDDEMQRQQDRLRARAQQQQQPQNAEAMPQVPFEDSPVEVPQ